MATTPKSTDVEVRVHPVAARHEWHVESVHDLAFRPDQMGRSLEEMEDDGWTLQFVDSGFLYWAKARS